MGAGFSAAYRLGSFRHNYSPFALKVWKSIPGELSLAAILRRESVRSAQGKNRLQPYCVQDDAGKFAVPQRVAAACLIWSIVMLPVAIGDQLTLSDTADRESNSIGRFAGYSTLRRALHRRRRKA